MCAMPSPGAVGGLADLFARAHGEYLSRNLGQAAGVSIRQKAKPCRGADLEQSQRLRQACEHRHQDGASGGFIGLGRPRQHDVP
jgi:hypothetical protein